MARAVRDPGFAASTETGRLQRDAALKYAAAIFAIGLALHTADHLRRGIDAVTPQVQTLGLFGTIVSVAAIAIALAGLRWAAPLAIAVGLSQAVGVAAVHLLPNLGPYSDAFPGSSVGPVSWAAVFAEIAGALIFAAAGAYVLRRSPIR